MRRGRFVILHGTIWTRVGSILNCAIATFGLPADSPMRLRTSLLSPDPNGQAT